MSKCSGNTFAWRVFGARHFIHILYCLFYTCLKEEHEKKKKQDGKRARADKDNVLELLFKAFERHQYYFLKDLIKITQQPVVSPAKRRSLNMYKRFSTIL